MLLMIVHVQKLFVIMLIFMLKLCSCLHICLRLPRLWKPGPYSWSLQHIKTCRMLISLLWKYLLRGRTGWFKEWLLTVDSIIIITITQISGKIDFDIHFTRKINNKKVTRRFDDSMSSLSNANEISMNWWYPIYKEKESVRNM